MYPATYFALFPPFPRNDKVFVAMSFDSKFDYRWEKVIAPAVRELGYEPYRVDVPSYSDSILTGILEEVANDLIIFADITTVGYLDEKPVRNSNVMYELGLAHATRLPQEIVIFRSDNDNLPFDVANVRVNSYSPDDNPQEALEKVNRTIKNGLEEINLQRNLSIKKGAEIMDSESLDVLFISNTRDGLEHPSVDDIERVFAINRLLEMGAIRANYIDITEDFVDNLRDAGDARQIVKYRTTNFGIALIDYVFNKISKDHRVRNWLYKLGHIS